MNEIVPLLVIFHLPYSKYSCVKICFYSCSYQNQISSLVSRSCRSSSTRVALVSHSCLTHVAHVSLASHSCRSCRTCVARVWHSCCKFRLDHKAKAFAKIIFEIRNQAFMFCLFLSLFSKICGVNSYSSKYFQHMK